MKKKFVPLMAREKKSLKVGNRAGNGKRGETWGFPRRRGGGGGGKGNKPVPVSV